MRVFFAIDLPVETKQNLAKYMTELQKTLQRYPLRWSKSHNLHITLQFLEKIAPSDIPKLIENVNQQIIHIPSFTLELGPIELFPSRYKPKIISLAVKAHPVLRDLSRSLGNSIFTCGYPIEDRPFVGHITLARINKSDPRLISEKLPSLDPFNIEIEEIVLFESQPSEGGSIYKSIQKFKLSASHQS